MRYAHAVMASAIVLGVASVATAAPLNLMLTTPDITSGLLNVTYNASTDQLNITGAALTIDFNGIAPPDYGILNGTFTLNATVNSSGVLTAGTLTIGGSVPVIGATSPLLTASLTAFGFGSAPVTPIFEFAGSVTGGSQAALYGSTVGTIVNLGGGFNGKFQSNFKNSGFGVADTGKIVPAPGALAALAVGGLALTRRRR